MSLRLTADRLTDPAFRDGLRAVISGDCAASGLVVETRDGVTTATSDDGAVHIAVLGQEGLRFSPPLANRRHAAE